MLWLEEALTLVMRLEEAAALLLPGEEMTLMAWSRDKESVEPAVAVAVAVALELMEPQATLGQ